MNDELQNLRREIEGLDQELIDLLARRFRRVVELGRCKLRDGLAIEDERREAQLGELHRELARRAGIDPAIVSRVFAAVLAESKRLQGQDLRTPGP